MIERIVILGGGLGALRTAQSLRDEGFDGDLRILSREPTLPYDRPPLSKAYLLGAVEEEALALATAEDLADRRIEVTLDAPAEGVDLDRRRVRVGGGDEGGDDAL